MKKLCKIWLWALALIVTSAYAQDGRELTGTVTSGGQPVPFSNVFVKGTTLGTQTDLDGKYKLTVPASATTLVFTSVGFKNKEVAIPAGTNVLDIAAEKDVLELNQVVVTALGIKKEQRALGYSVQQVKGEEVKGSGESNIVEGLAGKVAGVQIESQSGTPGASSKILIRGNATISGENQPLFVIDGIPVDNSTNNIVGDNSYDPNLAGVAQSNRAIDINPDDIESINVLKGPAASAIYGVRAGNGAVVITTKRGHATGANKISVVVSSSVEIDQVNKLPKTQDQYGQGQGGGEIDSTGKAVAAGAHDASKYSWGPAIDGNTVKRYDNNKDFFKTGVAFTNNVAVSGGDDNSTFRLSLGDFRQTGVVPNSSFERKSIRLTGDTKLSSKVSVGATANYINSGGTRAQQGSNTSGIMVGLLRSPADFDLKGSGSDGYKNPDGTPRNFYQFYDNPYWSAYQNPFVDNTDRILGNFNVSYKPIQWLDVVYRLGADQYTDARKQVFALNSQGPGFITGQIEENTIRHSEYYSDLLVTGHHDFSDKLSGSLLIGNNLDDRFDQQLYARGRNLSVPNFYNLSNASSLYANESHTTVRTAALFFNPTLSYNNMLYADFAGRNEWASTFGENKNHFFFFSGSASFVFTELIPKNDILSFGKLRASYGESGINPPVYSNRTTYAQPTIADGFTSGLSFPYQGQNGVANSSNNVLGNPGLRPERLTGREVGADLRFLNGRLNFDITYYNQVTTDAIISEPLPPSSGYRAFTANAASIQNQGIELVAGATPVQVKDFKWVIGMNYTTNKNKIVSLAPNVNEIVVSNAFTGISPYAIAGQPFGALYGYGWQRTPDGSILVDQNGIPKTSGTQTRLGNPYPKWTMGLRNTFTYQHFTLTGLLDIRVGGDIWNGTWARLNTLGRTDESADRGQTYVVQGEQAVTDVNGHVSYKANTQQISARDYFRYYKGDADNNIENAIQNGGWTRLRELTLSYHFKLSNSTFVKGLDLSLTGRNLMLWTKYKGVDPETSLTGAGSNVGGFDYFNNPGTKSYIFGATASF